MRAAAAPAGIRVVGMVVLHGGDVWVGVGVCVCGVAGGEGASACGGGGGGELGPSWVRARKQRAARTHTRSIEYGTHAPQPSGSSL